MRAIFSRSFNTSGHYFIFCILFDYAKYVILYNTNRTNKSQNKTLLNDLNILWYITFWWDTKVDTVELH